MSYALYYRGRRCSICGKKLDSYDTYSIKFSRNKKDEIIETVVCVDCDVDRTVKQKEDE
jgi:hypothetical protein